jgi:Sec-independent protein translocase protein TatA
MINKTWIVLLVIFLLFFSMACGLINTARDLAGAAGEIREAVSEISEFAENVEIGEPVSESRSHQEVGKPPEVSGKDLDVFPLHRGSVRTFYMQLTEDEKKTTSLVYAVPVDGEPLFEYYEKALVDTGWKISSTMEIGEAWFIEASKGDDLWVNLVIGNESDLEGDCMLMISVESR